jgi:hypothetical protein
MTDSLNNNAQESSLKNKQTIKKFNQKYPSLKTKKMTNSSSLKNKDTKN